MPTAILSLFALALLAPPLCRRVPRGIAAALALVPAAWAILLTARARAADGPLLQGGSLGAEALGLGLGFRLDGLALIFVLLVLGIGALVTLYAVGYFEDRRERGRFLGFLLAFMGSMLGLVLADDLILLFVFWELTSITSFLLIGFKHEKAEARQAALQSLLITAGGGLALLAGLLLLGAAAGSFEIGRILAGGLDLRQHPHYAAIVVLLVVGALTKSAQVPFHFWLPQAMAAPTPASAYLHSSTMVKAGIYLLARLHPALGATPLWTSLLLGLGGLTVLLGAWLALRQTDLKRTLAFSTITILGTLVALLGLGTELALKAAAVLLIAHGLYKGTLFLVVGILDQQLGHRDLLRLGGLARALPMTAAAGLLGAASMAGIPPFFGFIGKETVLEAAYRAPSGANLLAAGVALTGGLTAAAALLAGLRPFVGSPPAASAHDGGRAPREAHPFLWLGPLTLATLGLVLGLWPAPVQGLVSAAAESMRGGPVPVKLALWHGFNAVLVLGLGKIALGLALYRAWPRLRTVGARLGNLLEEGPPRLFDRGLAGLLALARLLARWLQDQPLHRHLRVVVVVTTLAVGASLWMRVGLPALPPLGLQPLEMLMVLVVLAATAVAVTSHSRLLAIVALGVVGYTVALIYLYYGAPDLAMTQLVIETLTVVLVFFAFLRLPAYRALSPPSTRRFDLLLSLGAGTVMGGLVLAALDVQLAERISGYFAAESLVAGKGRNVVNVILVDFRALDTLGEITVLAVGGLGALALLDGSGRRLATLAGPLRLPAPSPILRTATQLLHPLLLLLSVFLLWVGHHEPGGGFVGGLVAAAAFALLVYSHDARAARRSLGVEPRTLAGGGLVLALASGLGALLAGDPFMRASWWDLALPGLGTLKLGTPLLFDLGVYLVVLGVAAGIVFALAESAQPEEDGSWS